MRLSLFASAIRWVFSPGFFFFSLRPTTFEVHVSPARRSPSFSRFLSSFTHPNALQSLVRRMDELSQVPCVSAPTRRLLSTNWFYISCHISRLITSGVLSVCCVLLFLPCSLLIVLLSHSSCSTYMFCFRLYARVYARRHTSFLPVNCLTLSGPIFASVCALSLS